MTHIDVPQGSGKAHVIHIKQGGAYVDPDSNTVTPVILTPSSGSNPPTVPATATRVSKGVYSTTITALANTTLTTSLTTGQDWQVRYDFVIGGVSPAAADRTFVFDVVPAASVSEDAYYSTVLDVRRHFLDRRENQTGKTGTTLTLGKRDAVTLISITKNGNDVTVITTGTPTSTQAKLTRPATITLGTAAVTGDVYDIHVGSYLTDGEIEEHLSEVHEILDSKLDPYYSLPFASVPPVLAKIERWWTQYAIAIQLSANPDFRISKEEMDRLRERYEQAQALLTGLTKGSMAMLLEDGSLVDRITEAEEEDYLVSLKSSSSDNFEMVL